MTFNYIRNQIQHYRKSDLVDRCFSILEQRGNDKALPVWEIFIIVKWAYEYGETSYPLKKLTDPGFNKISNAVYELNNEHVSRYIKTGGINYWFIIAHSQQFYLQKFVLKETLATQLKLFVTIRHKYDVNQEFERKTGITIQDLIFFFQTIWIIIYSKKVKGTPISYYGYLSQEHFDFLGSVKGKKKVDAFRQLLVLTPSTAVDQIAAVAQNIRNTEWQLLARSFCTMYPLHLHDSRTKVIHESVFYYAANFYIYDLMKSSQFATDFGKRIEEYVDCGLKEIGCKYLNESALRTLFPGSKVVDYFVEDQNILIECKAVELSPIASINPSPEAMYNSLKDSIIKAYAKQMLTIANQLTVTDELFGLIITYKEFYTSHYTELFEISKKDISGNCNIKLLPPENVFIIDLFTWDRIIQIVKNGSATLSEILVNIKKENLIQRKQQFVSMSLDAYDASTFDLSYLKNELDFLSEAFDLTEK